MRVERGDHLAGAAEEAHDVVGAVELDAHAVELALREVGRLLREGDRCGEGGERRAECAAAEGAGEDGVEEVGWLLLLKGLLLKGLLFLGCYAWLLFLRWLLLLKGLLLKALFFLGCYAWLGCRRVLIGLIGLTGLTGLIGLIGLGREKVNEGGETRVVVEGLLVGIQNAISITGRSNVIPNQCIANHLLA